MLMSESVSGALQVETATGEAGRIGRKLRRRKPAVPAQDDVRAELRRLVKEHRNMTRKSVAIASMASDRTNRETGEVIPCNLPLDRQAEMKAVAKAIASDAARLESAMARELRKLPIYDRFLRHVYGVGPVVAAYLAAEIDVRDYADPVTGETRSRKPSQVKRFCGLAVIDGRLERPTRGHKLGYCSELRTRIFQAFSAMLRNASKPSADRPFGTTSKYLDVWANYKHRMAHSDRIVGAKHKADGTVDGKIVNGQGKVVSARGFIHSAGWHKAADVFVEDLYTVWRAVEGLPVWPSYYAAKLGYEHGGRICVGAPKLLTVDEALALVGDVGGRARTAPAVIIDDADEDDAA